MEKMKQVMDRLRSHPPQEIEGQKVISIEDYETGMRTEMGSNKTEKLHLPQSDVLLFRLLDKTRLVIRPSGTEPKIKIYAGVSTEKFPSLEEGIQECDKRLDLFLEALKKDAEC
jgi:phosphomannomutase